MSAASHESSRSNEEVRERRIAAGVVVAFLMITGFAVYSGARAGVASLFFREARREIESGDPEKALRILESVERWDSSHRETQRLLAIESIANGDLATGSRRLDALYDAGDRSVELLDVRARLAEERGDPATARARFTELCREHPTDVAGPLGLARLPDSRPEALIAFLGRDPTAADRSLPQFRGVSFFHLEDDLGIRGYGTAAAAASLVAARRDGVQAVALRVPARQSSVHDPNIRHGVEPAGGETDLALVRSIRDARRLGFEVMLKPHIMLEHITDDEWRGTIYYEDPDERAGWWSDYRAFVLHCAVMAQREHVDVLCIGVELRRMVNECPAEWRRLIAEIRGVFSGELTYAANWYHEFREVSFWSELDYIGVQFFFPISEVADPTFEELRAGLQRPLADLRDLADFYGRPVLFTEVGYKSTPGATREPWVWPQDGAPTDTDLQARAYEAVLETFPRQPWFAGMFWWNWLTEPDPGAQFAHDFTPQGKEALEVLRRHWGGAD